MSLISFCIFGILELVVVLVGLGRLGRGVGFESGSFVWIRLLFASLIFEV